MASRMKIEPRTVTVRGKRWKIYTCKLKPGLYGEADPPTNTHKEIRLSERISGMEALDTIIHELTHTAHWDLDETVVEQFATDVARILWGLGYRAPWDINKEGQA